MHNEPVKLPEARQHEPLHIKRSTKTRPVTGSHGSCSAATPSCSASMWFRHTKTQPATNSIAAHSTANTRARPHDHAVGHRTTCHPQRQRTQPCSSSILGRRNKASHSKHGRAKPVTGSHASCSAATPSCSASMCGFATRSHSRPQTAQLPAAQPTRGLGHTDTQPATERQASCSASIGYRAAHEAQRDEDTVAAQRPHRAAQVASIRQDDVIFLIQNLPSGPTF